MAQQEFIFELQWGGYYSYKEDDGRYGIWRLLDLKAFAAHCTLYKTKFDHQPTLAEAKKAEIFAMHAPLSPMEMLTKKSLVLLGGSTLTPEDLEGYVEYLKDHGQNDDKIVKDVIEYSTEHPQRVRIQELADQPGSIQFLGKV